MVGGADHKTGQGGDEREAMARLEQYVQERFHVDAIEQQWSAEFLEPADGLPYIGRLRTTRHVMTGAGYSGTGLTYGSVAGGVLADLHLGRASELAEIFSPSRFKPIARVCTHAGCRVQWNEFESTWDCPCHGGRYSALGKRLYGPPPNDLQPQTLDDL